MEAPDSGYSWVIVVCCAYIHFALFGIFRSSGVIYVAMLQNYDVTREEASWPFALAAGTFQLTGPVTSVFTYYMSQRKTCILGAIITTFGMAGCYFAKNIMWINIFYGVVHGFGFGILATLITVTLNQYFIKYRATAIGIAFSGGSMSTLVFPLAMEWLLENYSLTDSFLLLSGAVMNTLVAACFMKAPPWMRKPKLVKNIPEDSFEAKDSGVSTSVDHNVAKRLTTSTAYQLAPQAEPEDSDNDEYTEIQDPTVKSTMNGNKISEIKQAAAKLDSTESSQNLDTICSNNDSVLFGGSYSKLSAISSTCENSKKEDSKKCDRGVQEPLVCDKRIFIVPKKEVQKLDRSPESEKGIRYSLTSILKQPIFYKIAFTMCIYFLGVHSTFMVIVDFAKDKGIPEDKGVYIISMFSLTDLIGRAGLGWVTDRNVIQRKNMVCLNLIVLGIVYQLYPLIHELPGLLVIAAIHGLSVGCSITLFFVIQAERMGLKNLTLVVGLTSFINGIASFIRPLIIGLFRDVIGSYDWMFHVIGAITLIFALFWLAESYQTRFTNSVRNEKV